jgi:hypothetical protein
MKCSSCNERPARAKGMCTRCYQRVRYREQRNSEQQTPELLFDEYMRATHNVDPPADATNLLHALATHRSMLASGNVIPGFDHEAAIAKLESELAALAEKRAAFVARQERAVRSLPPKPEASAATTTTAASMLAPVRSRGAASGRRPRDSVRRTTPAPGRAGRWLTVTSSSARTTLRRTASASSRCAATTRWPSRPWTPAITSA